MRADSWVVEVVNRIDRLAHFNALFHQHPHQVAGAAVGAGHEIRKAHDALPGQRQLAQHLPTGCAQVWPDMHFAAIRRQQPAVERLG